jgi:3-dehydroquinate synthase
LAHGEAIAIGMICEAYLSKIGLGLSEAELEEISRFILAIYGHYSLQGFDYEHLINLMQQDKKNEGAGINFSLLPAIGQVTINCLLAPSFILESLAYYEAQAKI